MKKPIVTVADGLSTKLFEHVEEELARLKANLTIVIEVCSVQSTKGETANRGISLRNIAYKIL